MSDAVEVGQILKGYELKEILGKGGFGAVYRAYQPLVKREVAMKVILPAFANRPSFVRRFETEAQLVAQLEHLHIVPLYDYWRDPSGAYLVMRMLRGGTLEQDLKKNGHWSVEMTATLLEQMASALNVAHQTGVVHSDLKPANILLDLEKNGYLSDFGIASNLREEGGENLDDSLVAVGTPAYITPEQIQNQQLSPQSDIYSLGLVIFETLTGRRAFVAQNIYGYVSQQLTKDLPDVTETNPDIPFAVNEVLATATAKNPTNRYPDAQAFARAFRQAIQARKDIGISLESLDDTNDLIQISGDVGNLTITPELVEMEAHNLSLVNPYKGLRAFQQGDAKDFFGREEFTNSVLDRLRDTEGAYRFLAIIGPSGSGKSSVIKAGVLPALRRGAIPGSEHYYIAEMVPSTDALRELEAALLSIATAPPENMSQRLREDRAGLHELLNAILPDDDSEFLLLIDQFEEVFTQTNDNAVRLHFLESVRHAVNAPGSRLRVIVTLRADFYDKPLSYPDFGALVRQRTEIILPMNERELQQAITGPAERLGVRVEPALVQKMIEDVSNEPGALPLLQYALTENFERRTGYVMTLDAYVAAGGVLGALARRAEELYGLMDKEQKEAVRQLFLRLVTLGEGAEDTRRRILWSELVFMRDVDDPLQYVLDIYGKYRLLTFDTDPQTREPTVEVAHEALIRNWERLRQWLRESREDLRVQRRLATAVTEWRNAHQDASFLASGVRLQQFELLSSSKDISLTSEEKAYIQASIEKREALALEEAARQAREEALEARNRRILRWLAAVFAVAAVAGLILAVVAFNGQQEAQRQRVIAEGETVRAEAEAARAEREADESLSIILAQQAVTFPRAGEQPFDGLARAMEANRLQDSPVDAQRTLADMVYQPGAIRQFKGHANWVFQSAFTPDGSQMLTADLSGVIILWDVATGEEIRRFGADGIGHDDLVFSVAVSPDGMTAITGSQKKNFILWDLTTGEAIRTIGAGGEGNLDAVWAIAYLPDGQSAIIGSNDANAERNLIQWDLNTGEIIRRFEGHAGAVFTVDLSPDGQYLASAGGAGEVRLWDLATGDEVRTLEGYTKDVYGIAFSPDSARVIGAGTESTLNVWDVETGDMLEQVPVAGVVRGLDYSPDGNTFAAALLDTTVALWDAHSFAPLQTFLGHTGLAIGITYTPDGGRFASAAQDGVILWDVYGRGAEAWRQAETAPVYASAAAGDQIAVATARGVSLRNFATGELISEFNAETPLYSVALQGNVIAAGGADGSVTLWDTASGEVVRTIAAHTSPVRAIAISPDGTQLVTGGGNIQISRGRPVDNELVLWDAATGAEIRRLSGHTAPIRSAVFSADGTRVLSGSDDGSLILWDVATGERIQTFAPDNAETTDVIEGHTQSLTSVALSADGTLALSTSRDRTALLWDVATGAVVRRLLGHTAVVRDAAFSPDGSYVLTASGSERSGGSVDNTLILFDAATGSALRQFSGNSSLIRSVVFSDDGTQAISAANDGQLIAWHIFDLPALLDWVYANYEVDCVPTEIGFDQKLGANPRCQPLTVVTAAAESFAAFSPAQAENSDALVCAAPTAEGFDLPTTLVETTQFARAVPFTIGYSQASDDARSANIAAWARYEASQHEEIETFDVVNADGDYDAQVETVRGWIEAEASLILIEPIEQADMSALQSAIADAAAANIPVVLVNHRLAQHDYVTYVGVDDFQAGCIMAQELVAALDGEGTFARLNAIDATLSDNGRKAGATAGFANYPGLYEAGGYATGFDAQVIADRIGEMLGANPRVDGIWSYDGTISAEALQILLDSGRPAVPALGDQRVELARLLLDNNIDVPLLFIPSSMGADAVRAGLSILSGESVPASVVVPVDLIWPTADDLNDGALINDLDGLPEEFHP
ncbi:MAG: protein kinase [Anaerolineae bacterium]|nr:protein kinase [Anaerolineae bacterium]